MSYRGEGWEQGQGGVKLAGNPGMMVVESEQLEGRLGKCNLNGLYC